MVGDGTRSGRRATPATDHTGEGAAVYVQGRKPQRWRECAGLCGHAARAHQRCAAKSASNGKQHVGILVDGPDDVFELENVLRDGAAVFAFSHVGEWWWGM